MSNLISLAYPSLLHTQADKPHIMVSLFPHSAAIKKKEKEKLNKKLLLAPVATGRFI